MGCSRTNALARRSHRCCLGQAAVDGVNLARLALQLVCPPPRQHLALQRAAALSLRCLVARDLQPANIVLRMHILAPEVASVWEISMCSCKQSIHYIYVMQARAQLCPNALSAGTWRAAIWPRLTACTSILNVHSSLRVACARIELSPCECARMNELQPCVGQTWPLTARAKSGEIHRHRQNVARLRQLLLLRARARGQRL